MRIATALKPYSSFVPPFRFIFAFTLSGSLCGSPSSIQFGFAHECQPSRHREGAGRGRGAIRECCFDPAGLLRTAPSEGHSALQLNSSLAAECTHVTPQTERYPRNEPFVRDCEVMEIEACRETVDILKRNLLLKRSRRRYTLLLKVAHKVTVKLSRNRSCALTAPLTAD